MGLDPIAQFRDGLKRLGRFLLAAVIVVASGAFAVYWAVLHVSIAIH